MSSYSELQHLQDDPDANAPEAYFESHSEPYSDDSLPEVVERHGGNDLEVVQEKVASPTSKAEAEAFPRPKPVFWRRRRWILTIATVLICVLAIALGLGLGFGLKKSGIGNSQSNPNGAEGPPLTRGIANDSSFAAVTQLDGTRHVFFQDINGSIRQAISSRAGSAEEWPEVSLDQIIATDARASTPLTGFLRTNQGKYNERDKIYLFYVNTNDTLISLNWQAESGWWSSPPFENVTNINDFTVSKTSKSFSAAAIVQDEPSGTDYNFGILIALHDASDQVQFLYGYEAQNNGVNVTEDFVWNNVTGNLPADPELKLGSLQNATLSNFAVAGPINNTLISCIHVNCPTTTDSDHWQSYYILQQNNTNASALPTFVSNVASTDPPGAEPGSVLSSFLIQANDSRSTGGPSLPASFYFLQNSSTTAELSSNNNAGTATPPQGPFEFTNVGVTIPSGAASPEVYMYYQGNGSFFNEGVWSDDTGKWTYAQVVVDTAT